MSGRYEITSAGTTVEITDPFGCVLTLYDGAHPTMTGAIRQLLADLAAVSAERDLLAREISEADDLARHFVRDRPTLRARGAIVLQADEIAKLRAAAPQPQVAVTDAICDRVADRINHGAFEARPWAIAKRYLEEFQSELGPALGLAAWREPTDVECAAIVKAYHADPESSFGRAMFNAVKEVLGGGE